MPYFSNQPDNVGGGGLAASLRRAIGGLGGGGGLDPMTAIKIDHAAADTAHKLQLMEKLRGESERQRKVDTMRADPNAQSQFASDVAGTDSRTGRRIFGNLRGEAEPWSAADQDDAGAAGVELKPYTMAMPNVGEPIVRRMQDALAALQAEQFGEGKSNAEQLMKAAGLSQEQRVFSTAAEAAKRGDVSQVNLNAAGVLGKKELTPFKTDGHGITTNEYTGSRDETGTTAKESINRVIAQAKQASAAARNSDASAGLHSVQRDTAKFDLEAARVAGVKGKPPQGYMWGPQNAAGQPTLVKIEGGPVDLGKQLPHAGVKDLAGAGTAVEDTARLRKSFLPEFGGKTILGDMSNTFKRVVGDESGQAQWWQDMDSLQNQTRHALFGSALTATELKAWEKTSITPRMEAKQIEDNLQRRQEIEARAASKLGRAYEAAGYNKAQISELLGVGSQYLTNAAPVVAPVNAQNASGKVGKTATAASAARKTVGGKAYVKVNGEWFEE